METSKPSTLNSISTAFLTFFKVLPSLLLFEIVYKLLCELIFQPALSGIIQWALKLSGYHIAFNGDIAGFFTNIPGIIGTLIIGILAAFLAYFEYAVIILMIYSQYKGQPMQLSETMKQALTRFKSLKSLGIIGFAFYSLGLLPLINFGLSPAIRPSGAIPNFISGELYKSIGGSILMVLFYIIIYILFFATVFILPAMILRGTRFGQSFRVSLFVLLSTKIKQAVPLIILFIAWCVLLVYPGILPTYYAGVTDASFAEILANFFYAWRGIVHLLLVEGIQIIFTILLFTFLVSTYLQSGGKVFFNQNATPKIDRSLKATHGIASKLLAAITFIGNALRNFITSRPFYQKHKKPIWAISILLIFLIIFGALYSQPLTYDQVVVGHRGSQAGPENTIQAIDGAIDSGADYAEIDILLSKDGIPMVIHDDNLKRLTGENLNVYDLTATELSKLTITQNDQTGKISTLDEILNHCRGKIDLIIELKLHGHEKRNLPAAVISVVEKNHFQKNCKFMSNEYSLVEELKLNYPEYTVGYCVYGNLGNADFSSLRQLNVDFLIIEESMASKSFISKCNQAWLPVYVWTINEKQSMESCLKQGASGIITDKPKLARTVVDQFIKNSR